MRNSTDFLLGCKCIMCELAEADPRCSYRGENVVSALDWSRRQTASQFRSGRGMATSSSLASLRILIGVLAGAVISLNFISRTNRAVMQGWRTQKIEKLQGPSRP